MLSCCKRERQKKTSHSSRTAVAHNNVIASKQLVAALRIDKSMYQAACTSTKTHKVTAVATGTNVG